jgi:heptosyltransferase-2
MWNGEGIPMAAVAIVQTAYIGDVVLATPLLESARKSLPTRRVVAVVRRECENVLGNNPFVDEILVWDKRGGEGGIGGVIGFAGRLRSLGVETALVPHRSFRTGLAVRLAGVNERIGFSKGGGALFHSVRVPYRYGIHEVERNLMLAAAAGWIAEGLRPGIFPDDTDCETVERILAGAGAFCVFAPGSVWPTKRWPAESYAEVGCHFFRKGLRVVMSGGSDDRGVCARIAGDIPGALDVSGKLTIRQSAELYRRALFVLTGDTAPQHLAAAMDARVFSLFGPTIREFGFWPYTGRGVVIEEGRGDPTGRLYCRPCGAHGHRDCPNRTHLCMRRITGKAVEETIEKHL